MSSTLRRLSARFARVAGLALLVATATLTPPAAGGVPGLATSSMMMAQRINLARLPSVHPLPASQSHVAPVHPPPDHLARGAEWASSPVDPMTSSVSALLSPGALPDLWRPAVETAPLSGRRFVPAGPTGRLIYGTPGGQTRSCSCSYVLGPKNQPVPLHTADGQWLNAVAKAELEDTPGTWTNTKARLRALLVAQANAGGSDARYYHDAQALVASLYRRHVNEKPGLSVPDSSTALGRFFGARQTIWLPEGHQVRVFGAAPRSRDHQLSSTDFRVSGRTGNFFYYVLEPGEGSNGLDLIFVPYQKGLGMFLGLASPALQWGELERSGTEPVVADALLER